MKYPPKQHQGTDFKNSITTMKQFPLATLISAKDSEIFTTHVPLMYEATDGKFGKLIGHIDKFNPQVELLKDGNTAQVIFHGPDCYISPNIYSTTQLPTWNYVKVHLTCNATRIQTNEDVIASIAKMTAFLETSETPYVLNENDKKVQSLADYIVGFELEISSWEGKFKLSQDKLPKDRNLAKEALIQKSRNDVTTFLNGILNV